MIFSVQNRKKKTIKIVPWFLIAQVLTMETSFEETGALSKLTRHLEELREELELPLLVLPYVPLQLSSVVCDSPLDRELGDGIQVPFRPLTFAVILGVTFLNCEMGRSKGGL